MKTVRRAAVAGVAAASSLALGSCASPAPRTPTVVKDNSGVTVTVRFTTTAGGKALKATFSPDRPGFHIYSISLPDAGINGLGIPTRLSAQGGLAPVGPVTADKPVKLLDLTDLGVRLPVYPDGSVTLTLPVTTTGSARADVIVSYAACSPTTCMAPVTRQSMSLDLH